MFTKFAVVQGSVVVMEFEGGMSSVICVAVTNEAAQGICEALEANRLAKIADQIMSGEV